MRVSKKVRIRVKFPKVSDNQQPAVLYDESIVWFLLYTKTTRRIADLEKKLMRHIDTGLWCADDTPAIKLWLDNGLLPKWESTNILHDGDLIR